MRGLFDELGPANSTATAERLRQQIDILLVGEEVPTSHVSGDSKSNSDNSRPEVFCHLDGSTSPDSKSRTPYCTHGSELTEFDEKKLTFRLQLVLEEHSLQVRVRALGYDKDGSTFFGDWSPWEFVSTRWLNDACQPVALLDTPTDSKAAIAVGGWIAAAVRVVESILSLGNSGSAARQALPRAAQEIVRLILKKEVLTELMTGAIKGWVNDDTGTGIEKTDEAVVRLMIDCVGHGAGLRRSDIVALGEETLREYHRVSPELSDINIESAIEAFGAVTETAMPLY